MIRICYLVKYTSLSLFFSLNEIERIDFLLYANCAIYDSDSYSRGIDVTIRSRLINQGIFRGETVR